MKRWLTIGVALGLGLMLLGAAVEQSLKVNQFGGLLEDSDPLALPDDMAQDAENVITDLGAGLEPREGFIGYSTEPAKAMWVFAKSNGTRYIIAHSSNSLKADSGSKLFATNISTVAAGIVTAGAQLGDYFYFCNTVDGLKRWDGATTSLVNASLTFDKLVAWKGRLVGAGKPSSERTLFLSRYLDGTDWTLEVDPTDDGPAQITVGGALDENITGLFSSFKDLLTWFKNNSFGGLYGSRRSNFTLRTISDSVGCNHPRTAQDCDGALRFLGPRRTVWEFNGTNLTKISEGNNALFDQILNGESNTQTATITSKADFDAGTMAGLSSSISSGDILLSTWTATDTAAADFGAGTLTNTTTQTVSGTVHLSTNENDLSNNSFESGAASPFVFENGFGITNLVPGVGEYDGSYAALKTGTSDSLKSFHQTIDWQIRDSADLITDNGSFTWPNAANTCNAWTVKTLSLAAHKGKSIKVAIGLTSLDAFVVTPLFYSNGNSISFAACYWQVSGGTPFLNYLDLIDGSIESTIYSGSFVSQGFDASLSSPSWLSSGASMTPNGHTMTAKTQTSDNGSSWDTAVAWTTGTAPISAFKRYVRYQIDISTTSNGTALPYVSDVTLAARQSTGTFVSDTKALGSSISSWNVFQRDETLNDGTITYGFYTDTDTAKTIGGDGLPVVGTFTSSQTITNNTIPSVSTASFAFISAKFNITASTQNPTVSRLATTWNEGSDLKAKGVWTKQRYWLATSLASVVSNDTIFVYDRRQHWQKYTGMNVDDMILFNSFPFFSNPSGIFQGETGTSDNGADISSTYTTKYFWPVGPETRGYLRELWMTTTNSDATLGTQLFYDGAATPITLGEFVMNERQGYQVKKLPIPAGGLQMARHVALKWTVSGTERWKLLNGSLYFDPDSQRE